ncbi:MAG: hypothetical protein ACHRHE_20770 [Tepidisphaerales bacterium]
MPDTPPWNQPGVNDPLAKKALLTLRIIWAALLMGQLMFLGIILSGVLQQQFGQPRPVLTWTCFIMAAVIIPVTYVIRTFMFQKAETPQGLPAGTYASGSIIFWAGCEGMSFFGLVVAMVNASLWPTIMVVVIAMGLQVLTFPVAGRLDMSGETPRQP